MRHLGIALALLILAPIAQHELDTTLQDTRLRGAALILDARIDPRLKLELAPKLNGSVETEDPRGGLDEVFADARDEVDSDQLGSYDDLAERADDLLVTAVNDGFRTAFLVAAGLALLAGRPARALQAASRPARPPGRVRGAWARLPGCSCSGCSPQSVRPEPVAIADPCKDRQLPSTGGVAGFAQDAAAEGRRHRRVPGRLLPGGAGARSGGRRGVARVRAALRHQPALRHRRRQRPAPGLISRRGRARPSACSRAASPASSGRRRPAPA